MLAKREKLKEKMYENLKVKKKMLRVSQTFV